MNIKCIIGCLLLLTSVYSNTFSQHGKLALEIKISKNIYLLGEAIYINVYLKNLTSDTVVTNSLSMDDSFLNFLVQDKEGKNYYDTYHKLTGKTFGLKLPPNSVEYWVWDINARYGINSNFKHYPSKNYLPVGKYSVIAVFQSGYDMMRSNTLELEIVEPHDEELEAFKLLSHADDLRIEKKFDEALQTLDTLKTKHIRSVYRPMAFRVQIFILNYGLKDETNAYPIAKSLIDAYPNSEYALMALTSILTHVGAPDKDRKIRKEILQYVTSKYPGTRVAEFGEKTLQGDKARE